MRQFFKSLRPKSRPEAVAPRSETAVENSPNGPLVAAEPEDEEAATLVANAPEVSVGVKASEEDDELVLEFGDFLRTIPPTYLKTEGFNLQTPLRFDLNQIARSLLHGQSTIPLLEISRRVPDAFRDANLIPDAIEIRFPWQKVVRLLNESAASTEEGKEALVMKLRRRQDAACEAMRLAAEAQAAGGQAASREREKIWFTRKSPQTGAPANIQPFPSVSPGAPNGQPVGGRSDTSESSKEEVASGRLIALTPPAGNGKAVLPAAAPKIGNPATTANFLEVVRDDRASEEALTNARQEAAEKVRVLQTEHEQQIAALLLEKQLALEARDQRIAQLEAEAEARTVELQQVLGGERNFDPEQSHLPSGGEQPGDESTVADLEERLLAIHSEHEAALSGLRAETEQVVGDVRDEAARRIAAMQEELERERVRLDREREAAVAELATERDSLVASLSETRQSAASEFEERLANLTAEHQEALAAAKQDSERLASQIREEANARVKSLEENFRAEQEKLSAEERRQADALIPQLVAAQAAVAAKDAEIAQLRQEHESALQAHRSANEREQAELAAAREEAALAHERDSLLKATATELSELKARYEEQVETFSGEKEALQRLADERDALLQEKELAETILDERVAELTRRHEEALIAAHSQAGPPLEELKAEFALERDRLQAEQENALAEKNAELSALQERLQNELSGQAAEYERALQLLAGERDGLAERLAALANENEAVLANFRAEWDAERTALRAEFARERALFEAEKESALEAALKQHKALLEERDLATREYKEQIAILAHKYDSLLTTMRQEAEEMVSEVAQELTREREALEAQRVEAKTLAAEHASALATAHAEAHTLLQLQDDEIKALRTINEQALAAKAAEHETLAAEMCSDQENLSRENDQMAAGC